MKKILLGTSALAAVALTAGSASAEAPTVKFDGSVAYEYIFYDNSNRTSATKVSGRGQTITANDQQSELHWTVTGAADNGLEYTGRIDWRYLAGSFDESWIKLGGGWGDVVMGQDDGAEGNMPDALSLLAATWGTDGNNIHSVQNNLGLGTTLSYFSPAGATSDANKVAYYTPDFGGFSAAASFTPTSGDSGASGVPADAVGDNVNITEVSAKYAGEFGAVGLTVAGSYINGEQTSSNGADLETIGSYHLGALLSVGDFGAGLGYIDSGDSGTVKGTTNEALSGYNASIAYTMGDLYMSAYYQHTENNTGAAQDNEYDIVAIGANYTIAEGLSTYAQYSNSTMDLGGTTGSAGENDADVLILGTKISF